MPSFFRTRSPSPTAIPFTTATPVKTVGFPLGSSPVTSVSRPLTNQEQWTLYHFEAHARTCSTCIDPYEVHKAGGCLCDKGHLLAQDVACIIYSAHRGRDVFDASLKRNGTPVKVELPYDYHEVMSLLKAMERSIRHRRQKPIVSFDRTYPIWSRASKPSRRLSYHEPTPEVREVILRERSPKRSSSLAKSSRQSSPPSKQERRRSQVVEWPEEDLLALEARAPPTSWKGAVLPAVQTEVEAASTRPVTPENRSTRSRDHSSSPAKVKTTRPSSLSVQSGTSSPSRSKDSPSSSPRIKAARASALALLESATSSVSSTRPGSRDGPANTTAQNPFAGLSAPEAASARRRSRVVDAEGSRRASMYAGTTFKTEVREPKSRRSSATFN